MDLIILMPSVLYIMGFIYCSKTFMLYQQIVSKLYGYIIVSESAG